MMRRILSLVIAVALLLTALVVPQPAVKAEVSEVVPFDFEERGRWDVFIEPEMGEINNQQGVNFITSTTGTVRINYKVAEPAAENESAWIAYYKQNGIAKHTIGMRKPDNGYWGAMVQIDGATYTQEDMNELLNGQDEMHWRGGFDGWNGFFPQIAVQELTVVEGKPTLRTKNSTTTFLLAWKDEDGNLIDMSDDNSGVFVEILQAVIAHDHPVSEQITLSEFVLFDRENNSAGYDMGNGRVSGEWLGGCQMQPGLLHIDYEVENKSFWENAVKNSGTQLHQIGFAAPPNATEIALFVAENGETEEQALAALNGDAAQWHETSSEEHYMYRFPVFDYETTENADGTVNYTYKPLAPEFDIYVSWRDANKERIDLGIGQYVAKLHVEVVHVNENTKQNWTEENVKLPQVVDFDFGNSLGYGMGHDPLNPLDAWSNRNTGELNIDYHVESKEEWEAAVENTSSLEFKHQIGFWKPNGAEQVAIFVLDDDGLTEEDAIAHLQGENAQWQSTKDGDIMHTFPVFRSVITENNGTTNITYNPLSYSFNIYVMWKDADGTPIDLGMGRSIARLHVNLRHEVEVTATSWTKELGDQTAVESPYSYAVPLKREMIRAEIPGVDASCFSYDTRELDEGKLKVIVDMNAQDWRNAYTAWDNPGIPMAIFIPVDSPVQNMPFANVITTGSIPDPDLAAGMIHAGHAFPPDGVDMATTVATYTTNGNEVTVVPIGEEHTFMLSWKGNANADTPCYNFGTLLNPVYVEYLTLTVEHKNKDAVRFTVNTSVEASDLTPNANGLADEMFVKDSEFDNDILTYHVDAVKLQKAIDEEGKLPKYSAIRTFVAAPEGVSSVEVNGEAAKLVQSDNRVGVNLDSSVLNYNGNLENDVRRVNYKILWKLDNGEERTQKIAVHINVIGDELWLDHVFDAEPITSNEVIILDALNGENGVKVEMVKDGHLQSSLTGEKIKYNKLEAALQRQFLIKVPENAAYYKTTGGGGASIYLGDGMAEETQTFLENADFQRVVCDEEYEGYLTMGRLPTVKQVKVEGEFGTKVKVLMPDTLGYDESCGVQWFYQWFDEDKNPIKLTDAAENEYYTQYFYYTLNIQTEMEDTNGVESDDELTGPVKYPTIMDDDYILETEEFQQEQEEGAEGDAQSHYMRIRLKYKKNGAYTQPKKEVNIYLPYPEGLSFEKCHGGKYKFYVRHYLDDDHTNYELIEFKPMKYGLYGKVKGFSPFMLSWIEEEDEQPGNEGGGSDSGSGSTGGGSNFYPDYDEEQEEPEAAVVNLMQVTCRKLNVRAGAGTEFEKIGSLRRGAVVEGKFLDNGWAWITLEDGTIGYICASYVDAWEEVLDAQDKIGEGSVVCRKLNVRRGAGTEFEKIGSLSRCESVEIVGSNRSGTWLKIRFEDTYAWVCAKYIAEKE